MSSLDSSGFIIGEKHATAGSDEGVASLHQMLKETPPSGSSLFAATQLVAETNAPVALAQPRNAENQVSLSVVDQKVEVSVAERNRKLIRDLVQKSLAKQIERSSPQFEELFEEIFEICGVRIRHQKSVFTPGQMWAKNRLQKVVNDQVTHTVKDRVDISDRKMIFDHSSDSSNED